MTTAYVTQWSEERVLEYFWASARDGAYRIDLLKQLANVAIQRPSDWDERSIRQAMEGVRLTVTADRCFACLSGERRLYWHHVIQVQHGGSSCPQNLVSLCHACHRRVHPWLKDGNTRENRRGWTSVRDIAIVTIDKLLAMWDARVKSNRGGEAD